MTKMKAEPTSGSVERVFQEWHDRAKSRNVTGLLELYAENAVFESPLVPAILDDKQDGVLIGLAEIRRS